VDVYEANGDLVIHAELPGVEKQDIKLTLDNGDLLIEGERKSEEKLEEKDYYRMERMAGSFYRRLPLPAGVKPEQIHAQYTDGVLEVRVPKGAAAATAHDRDQVARDSRGGLREKSARPGSGAVIRRSDAGARALKDRLHSHVG
jgi:HSP20 family protein